MRIDYNILWFEDIKSSFEAKKQIVRAIVEELGFDFPEPRNEVNGDKIHEIDYDLYNLIIVDLSLAGSEKGPDLINKIRNNEGVYTEVIFYSSDGEKAVRNALRDLEIDGAYCAGRDNDDFEDKVRKVILNTVKKIRDVNNMRGLIMAETSDLDELMRGAVLKFAMSPGRDELKKYLCKMISNSLSSNLKKISELCDGDNVEALINHRAFDADKMARTIDKIVGWIGSNDLKPLEKFSEEYRKDVLSPRNQFGHVKEKMVDGKKVLESHLEGEQPIIFTEELCREIKVNLRKHRSNLRKVFDSVNR